MQMLMLTIMHMLMYLVYPVHVVYLSILIIKRLYSYGLYSYFMCVCVCVVCVYV